MVCLTQFTLTSNPANWQRFSFLRILCRVRRSVISNGFLCLPLMDHNRTAILPGLISAKFLDASLLASE